MADREFTLHIEGPEGFQADFRIPPGITRIGRQPGSDLMLPHTQVSRQHAQLEATADTCEITDLGSSNGTHVNDEKLVKDAPVSLKNNDRIKIGPFQVLVRVSVSEGTGTVVEEPLPADPSIVSEVKEAPEDTRAGQKTRKAAEAEPVLAEEPAKADEPAQADAAAQKGEATREKTPAAEAEPEQEAAPARDAEPAQEPPPPPTLPPPPPEPMIAPDAPAAIPGLTIHSRRLIDFLPGIYHTDFMARFLGIFEATVLPIEWTIEHFDLFLQSGTAPGDFLPWLASWYGLTFDSTWTDEMRRTLIAEAHQIYARRGTRWALSRILEIYTGAAPEIDDRARDLDPFTFTVTIPLRKRDLDADLIENLIDAHKPAHTSYKVRYGR